MFCLYVCLCPLGAWFLWKVDEGIRSPRGIRDRDSFELPCPEIKPRPSTTASAEPSLQPRGYLKYSLFKMRTLGTMKMSVKMYIIIVQFQIIYNALCDYPEIAWSLALSIHCACFFGSSSCA